MMWTASNWRRVLPLALFCGALPLAALTVIPSGPLAAQDQPQAQPSEADALAKAKDLIGKLQSDDYETRETARKDLEKMGRAALPALKKALESTTDPDLGWRLEELIEKAGQAAEPREQQRPFRQPMEANPNGGGILPGGFSGAITLVDGSGRYSKSSLPGGGVRASRTPNGGTTETREFKSEEEFKQEWPEVADKFSGLNFRFRVNPQPGQQQEDQQQDERGPQIMPFPGPFGGQADEATEELQRRLQQLLEQMMNGRNLPQLPDPDNVVPDDFQKMLEDMQRRTEELQRQFEDLGRGIQDAERAFRERLQELRERRPDPESAPDAFRQWMEEWQRLNEEGPGGNGDNGSGNSVEPQSGQQAEPARPQTGNEASATVGGVSFGPVHPAIRAQLQLGDREGLLVNGISDEGLLVKAGLKRFDVLLSVNQRPVFSTADVVAALADVPEGAQYVITVIRKKERLQLLGNK